MIIFFNPASTPSKKPHLPLSLLALGGLIGNRSPYRILDGNLMDDQLQSLTEVISETDARILCMTVMPGPQLVEAVPLTKAIKGLFPDLTIIWGGYFPTLYSRTVAAFKSVDFAFCGYVEATFADFIESVLEGEPDLNTPGLIWRDQESDEIHVHKNTSVPNVNDLPLYPYHKVDMEQYIFPTFLGSRTVSHHVSYGCPFKCNFCGVVNMVNGGFSGETAEKAAAGVERLVRDYDANAIMLVDNNFFVGERRTVDFCERIKRFNIRWWTLGRVDTLMKYSDDTWRAMQASGLHMIFVGAETGSDDMLKQMNKGGKLSTNMMLEFARRTRQFGIVPEYSFIVGNPPDPEKDLNNTMNFIGKIKKLQPEAEIVLYGYSPVPVDGEMLSGARAMGFQFPHDLDDWTSDHWLKIVTRREADLPWVTPRIRRRISNFRLVLDSAYPTSTDANLKGIRRGILKAAGGWRHALGFYHMPIELKLINRLIPYQRPETAGF